MTLMSCKPSSDVRMSVLCFQVVTFRDNSRTSHWNFATWFLYRLCRFPLSRFIFHSQRILINFIGQDWRKRLLPLWENSWITWRLERFCLTSSKLFECLSVSADPGYKLLRECIRCLYYNVIDRLGVTTIQSINDRREQMFRLDTSQPAPIRVPIVH